MELGTDNSSEDYSSQPEQDSGGISFFAYDETGDKDIVLGTDKVYFSTPVSGVNTAFVTVPTNISWFSLNSPTQVDVRKFVQVTYLSSSEYFQPGIKYRIRYSVYLGMHSTGEPKTTVTSPNMIKGLAYMAYTPVGGSWRSTQDYELISAGINSQGVYNLTVEIVFPEPVLAFYAFYDIPMSSIKGAYYVKSFTAVSRRDPEPIEKPSKTETLLDGLLGWIKNIFNKISSMPADIANAVKGFFTELGNKISSGLTSLGNKVTSALTALGNFIIEGLKTLFIPSDSFMQLQIKQWQELLEKHFNILYYPATVLGDILNRFMSVEDKAGSINIPELKWGGDTFFGPYTFEFTIIKDEPWKFLHDIYLALADIVLIVALFGYIQDIYNGVFKR